MDTCPDTAALIEGNLDKILTQYRESPNLIHVIRTYLQQVGKVMDAVCAIPSFFDIDQAVGDQLTIIGKRLGWPREHCVCISQPVFGFDCDDGSNTFNIAGFCDDTASWEDCGVTGIGTVTIASDDMYRRFLKVRRYQMMSLYDLASLEDCVRIFFGDTAVVMDSGNGRVVVAPGRALTQEEENLLQLYPRVLPVAPGVRVRFHFGDLLVFGFGDGWGGFCDPLYGGGAEIETENGVSITDHLGNPIMTGAILTDSEWMCEVDVSTYKCAA